MDIDKIIQVRLMIAEPIGYPLIEDSQCVGDDEQTAYRVGDSKYYNSDEERLTIYNSDSSIDAWISQYGVKTAAIYACERIIANLSVDVVASMSSLGESMSYASINQKLNLYNSILNNLKSNNNRGTLMLHTKKPTIAGGML